MSELLNTEIPVNQSGYVWFVGAGPGAADLITVRGLRALEQADVVIHDELAGRELLEFCRPDCRLFHVGKRAGCHSASQDEINQLLVAQASEKNRVVRLKGGDPAVFGRLGEEIAALRQAGLRFEIVPGVTAACTAAAAAGISLTQRGFASAAILATGHECSGKSTQSLDWESLAQPGTTLCVYMGTRSLPALASRLVAQGHAPETPLLVVSHASLPAQTIRAAVNPTCTTSTASRTSRRPRACSAPRRSPEIWPSAFP